ncbi:hypothetical protein C8A00DRAFT_38696, partial [Chaetomidium leptoderma]
CIRTAIKATGPHDEVPVEIFCEFTAVSSFKCNQCNERHSTGCNPVAGGMTSDMLDLMIIIRSARALCVLESDEDGFADEDEEEEYRFDLEKRRRFAKLANDCVETFLRSESAHWSQFGMGDEKNPTSNAALDYANFVTNRQQLLANSLLK